MRFFWPNFIFGNDLGTDIMGTDRSDWVFARGGNDKINTGDGNDRVFAGRGDDEIDLGSGHDKVWAGLGDDIIKTGAGNDFVNGGRGFDTVVYEGSISDYTITAGRWGNTSVAGADGTDTLRKVEALYFEADDFTYYLDGTNNRVLAGDDMVSAGENEALLIDAATLLANDQEFDGDAIAITSVAATSALGVSVGLADGKISYNPGSAFDYLAAGEVIEDTFTYTVDDGKGGTDTATVTIKITGENDAPSFDAPGAISVAENTSAVLAGITATDAESDAVTFSLGGTDAALFDIDGTTGAISFRNAPDFETPLDDGGDNTYNVTIIASDGKGGETTSDLAVTVTDVNELPEVDARINEFHYDNAGGDIGEFVEIRVARGDDVSFLSVAFYNGSNGTTYRTAAVSEFVKTSDETYDYYVLDLPSNGIQNGSPDGLALANGENVIEFLSYEGALTATNGVAVGLESTDIGVSEPGTTPVGFSLQRNADGTWREAGEETKGLDNDVIEAFAGRINEFHYDNTGGDVGEFIEVRVDLGTDISASSVVLYNGSNGASYNTLSLADADKTSDASYDYYVFDLPSNGLQNGSPDGLALVDNTGTVVEFLSYEGTLTATDGVAAGLESTDIGVSEPGTTPVGFSLQRNADGTWREAEAETKGAANEAATEPFSGRINEFHYDNSGGDLGEFIEVRVALDADVSGASVVLYNGNGGAPYNTLNLSDATKSSDGTFDYYVFDLPSNGLQNGSPDGLALVSGETVVEFLSYEGVVTASSGPAAGQTSTDVGVSEPSTTPVGFSLQRNEDGTWRAAEAETKGASNDGEVPFAGRINELHYDNAGSDTGEFIEVRVDKNADASMATVVFYNGSNGASYNTLSLSDATLTSDDDFDYYVFALPANGLQNGAPDGLALVNDGAVLEFLSYEGTLTASDGPAVGLESTDIGQAEGGATPVGFSLQRNADGTWREEEAQTVGASNDGDSGGGGGGEAEDKFIWQVQGSGSASPLLGMNVRIEGVVTYLATNGFYMQEEDSDADADAMTSEGIFVFTDSAEGLPSLGDVARVTGEVSETFELTQINQPSSVEIVSGGAAMPTPAELGLGPQSTIADFEAIEGMRFNLTSATDDPITIIESFEFGRFGEVVVSAGIQYQPTQFFDAQTEAAEIAELSAANRANRLRIDDGSTEQNPTEFAYAPAATGDNGNGFLDAGDTFTDAGPTLRLGSEMSGPVTGVMSFSFGEHKMLVDGTLPIDQTTNEGARQATPDDVGGTIQVGAFNVLNYFTTLRGEGTSGPNDLSPRGASSEADFIRQTDKIVSAMEASGVDVFAVQEVENGGFGAGSAIQTLADSLNASSLDNMMVVEPLGIDASGFIGTDAITTGILYDADKVTLTDSAAIVFEEPSAAVTFALAEELAAAMGVGNPVGDFQRNRPAVVATFEDEASGAEFTVVSVHFKSKGDSGLEDLAEDAQALLDSTTAGLSDTQRTTIEEALAAFRADANFDQGDGQGFWNGVRTDAATEVYTFLEEDYRGTGVDDYLIMGDFNAYSKEDPTQAVADQDDTVDLLAKYVGEDAYSFVFDGERGALDQVIAASGLENSVTGLTEWHINTDEPNLLDYNSSFNDSRFYNDGPYRSSDHDPVILGLEFADPLLLV